MVRLLSVLIIPALLFLTACTSDSTTSTIVDRGTTVDWGTIVDQGTTVDQGSTEATHSEDITVPGGAAMVEQLVILNFYKEKNQHTKRNNDVYFEGNCRDDFSDVRILDENGVNIPFDVISTGNYAVVADSRIPRKANIHYLSDGTLIGSFYSGGIKKSTDNGATWQLLSTDYDFAIFVSQTDTIYAHRDGKVGRSDAPYSVWTEVLDYTVMDSGNGVSLKSGSMVQLPTGELFIGRYQKDFDVKIFKSIDDGVTWQLNYATTDYQHVHAMFVDPYQDPVAIYAGLDGGGGGVLKSTDKGVSWSRLDELYNIPQAKDHGIQYADPSGYRFISGETAIVGGSSIIKTKDDVNFYQVLSNGKPYYKFAKLNGVLYAGGVASNDSRGAQIVRSIDDGESWDTVYAVADYDALGASDGYRYMTPAFTPYGESEEQLITSVQADNTLSPLRIFDGGDNYMASVLVKIPVPTTGRTLTVASGYSAATLKANISLEGGFSGLLNLPLNDGFGDRTKELSSGENLKIVNPIWVDGLRKLWEYYPAIRTASDTKALKFSDTTYLDKPFNVDLTAGGFSIVFWADINSEDIPGSKREIILAFNPLGESPQFLYSVAGYQLHQNGIYLGALNYPKTHGPKLFTITVDFDGTTTIYKNSGLKTGRRELTTKMALPDLSGELYLFGTPFTDQLVLYSGVRNFQHSVQHFELIDRILTQEEISSMYGGLITDLR